MGNNLTEAHDSSTIILLGLECWLIRHGYLLDYLYKDYVMSSGRDPYYLHLIDFWFFYLFFIFGAPSGKKKKKTKKIFFFFGANYRPQSAYHRQEWAAVVLASRGHFLKKI